MDSGASTHMTSEHGNLTSSHPLSSVAHSYAIVGNGSHLPITHTCTASLPTPDFSFQLHNVLVTPNLIKNLISVRNSLLIIIVLLSLTPTTFL